MERVPQDARGAAAAHDLRARHNRGQQGAADGRRPLPPLRLRAPERAADRRRGAARGGHRGIEIGDDAAALVARSATGSFRDALGTLEQLVAYSGRSIALDDVLAVLGAADADLVFGAVDAVAAGNAREALLASARLAESGRDLGRFFTDLEAHARALMVVQALGEVPAELRITPEQDERLAAQAKAVPPVDVTRLLDMIAAALRALKDGADARTQLELALVRRPSPRTIPPSRRCWRESSGSRPAPAAQVPRAPPPRRRRSRRRRRPDARRRQRPGRGPAARGGGDDGPGHARGRCARGSGGRRAGRVRGLEGAGHRADPAPAVRRSPSWSPTRRAPRGVARGELSLDAFAELWPAVLETLEGETPCSRPCCARRARRARRRRADAGVAGVGRVLQARR